MKSAALMHQVARVSGLLACALTAGPALAAEPSVRAEMECEAAATAVLCVVRFDPSHASHITWAEASVVSAPAFAPPALRKATYKESSYRRPNLRIVLVPSAPGNGTLVVKTRGVVCADDGTTCPHFSKLLHASFTVPPKSNK